MKTTFNSLSLIFLFIFLFNCSNDESSPNQEEEQQEENLTVTDIDGNVYETIIVGNQTWMLENLKVTTFNDGTPITEFSFENNGINWLNLNTPTPFYQWANTADLNDVVDVEMPFDYYGAMYNHLAIESGKLAPEGWRIPSVQDFIELEAYLNANGHAGNEATALKSDSGWLASSGVGTNAIGFNGLPNGYVSVPGTPTFSEGVCTWATSNVETNSQTRTMVTLFDQSEIIYASNAIQIGAAIRCIKIN